MSAGAVGDSKSSPSSKRRPKHRRPPPQPPPPSTTSATVRVKPEPVDDIKDYAETTMNELLGWYGYEKVVDRRDTQGLNLGHFAASSSEDERSGQDSAGEPRPRHHHKQRKHRRSARLTPLHHQRLATPVAVASSVGAGDDALVIAAPQLGEPGTSPRDDGNGWNDKRVKEGANGVTT
ncbi:uncharacterized protein [Dermacentor andersoni]|uniref:uncharacterized protein n=1 Tax=Dermacentor andersoni TaxID=34620 RepID=UPI003B3A20C6